MNERITEDLIKSDLKALGYSNIEEQKSANKKVQELLQKASKTGNGGSGRPEFIIVDKASDYVVIVECKADTKLHESENKDQPVKYAVDGVLHYASFLKKSFNVIAIAASGQSSAEMKVSNFYWRKGTDSYETVLDRNGNPLNTLAELARYKELVEKDKEQEELSFNKLIEFSKKIHEYMYSYAKLSETEKPLLVSGILLALNRQSFRTTYMNFEAKELAKQLLIAIETELKEAKIPENKLNNMTHTYSFIGNHPNLSVDGEKGEFSPLRHIIDEIKEKVEPFITNEHNYDAIGHFYGEFLKYTGGDKKSLGIVLTPRHVTDLFSDLVSLTPTSKVLDTCTGTGGFLISAMSNMTRKAKTDEEKIHIKKNCLYGVELQPNMYTLACANMILRGDGQANIYQGSCFDREISQKLKDNEIDYAFINPPYAQKGEGLHELDFIYHTLNLLKVGGKLIAIVPMSCAIQAHKTKEKLLRDHRLDAVMSMPEDLFYPVGTVTCIMVFTAHMPHETEEDFKTWFGYWKKDGFVKSKKFGRADIKGEWTSIRKRWINAYREREVIPELSVKVKVGASDEWCAEAYLETDYDALTNNDFTSEVKNYALFKLANENLFTVDFSIPLNNSYSNKITSLNDRQWKEFSYENIFTIKSASDYLNSEAESNEGTHPFIVSSERNNGLFTLTSLEPKNKGFSITVNKDGSVGEAFFQEKPFSGNGHILSLRKKGDKDISSYEAMFLITLIKKEKYKYSFGRAWGLEKMKKSIIKLPVDDEENPDWQFMEDYIKSLPFSSSI